MLLIKNGYRLTYYLFPSYNLITEIFGKTEVILYHLFLINLGGVKTEDNNMNRMFNCTQNVHLHTKYSITHARIL